MRTSQNTLRHPESTRRFFVMNKRIGWSCRLCGQRNNNLRASSLVRQWLVLCNKSELKWVTSCKRECETLLGIESLYVNGLMLVVFWERFPDRLGVNKLRFIQKHFNRVEQSFPFAFRSLIDLWFNLRPVSIIHRADLSTPLWIELCLSELSGFEILNI